MFDWLFKRSAKDYREGDHFVEPKFSDEQNIAPNEQEQLEQTEQDLIQIRDTLAQMLPSMSERAAQLQAQLDEASAKNILLQDQIQQIQMQHERGNHELLTFNATEATLDSENIDQHAKLSEHTLASTQELDDLRAENEILLSGMFEAQEELERQILSQQEFEQKKATLDGRFERLQKRYSSYIDYRQLNIISVDGITEVPEIVWEITDVFFAGMAFEKIEFKTILNEGKVGLWIMSMTKPNEIPIAFKNTAILFPELIKTDVAQQKLLRQIQNSHWRAFGAVVAAIELSIKTQWRDVTLPPEFDTQFWGGSLQSLTRDFARLPKVLRFDQAKLKQELVNPDYEHLWIELFDVSFGDVILPKFEFRIAAAQVQANSFSNYPKLEIPLIDGKIKPFKSWYEESVDDFGGKYELRFDLTKKVFDERVWSNLNLHDKTFLLSLIYSTSYVFSIINRANPKKLELRSVWFKIILEVIKIIEIKKLV